MATSLQGNPVSSATPLNGQALIFDGTNWTPGRTGSHNDFADRNLVTTGAVSIGTNPAAAGALRLANSGAANGIAFRNAANNGDIGGISLDGSNILWVGSNNGGTTAPTTAVLYGSSGSRLNVGNTAIVSASATMVTIAAGVEHGRLSFTPVNGANNLSAAQSANNFVDLQAGASGAVTITSTRTAASAGQVFVKNRTSQTVTWQWASGTGATIATGASAWIGSDGINAVNMT